MLCWQSTMSRAPSTLESVQIHSRAVRVARLYICSVRLLLWRCTVHCRLPTDHGIVIMRENEIITTTTSVPAHSWSRLIREWVDSMAHSVWYASESTQPCIVVTFVTESTRGRTSRYLDYYRAGNNLRIDRPDRSIGITHTWIDQINVKVVLDQCIRRWIAIIDWSNLLPRLISANSGHTLFSNITS